MASPTTKKKRVAPRQSQRTVSSAAGTEQQKEFISRPYSAVDTHVRRQNAALMNKTAPRLDRIRDMEKLPVRAQQVYVGTSPGKGIYPEMNQSADDIPLI